MTRFELIQKIRRKDELVQKWTLAANLCTGTDAASRHTKKYCLGLARSAQEKKAEYEEELRKLSAPAPK